MRFLRRTALPLLALALAACAHALRAPATDADLDEARRARFAAMVANDLAALERTLHPELVYTHTTGAVETREQLLASLRTGALRYRAISPSEVRARVHGDVALATGRVELRVEAEGRELALAARFTEVYLRTAEGWRLAAWQSTRLP